MFVGFVKPVQSGSVDFLDSEGFYFLGFLFRFFHAGDFAHEGGVEFFDGGSVDFVLVEFFGVVEGEVDVFVKIFELLFVGLGFEFGFVRVAFVVSEGGGLGEGAAGGLGRFFFDLFDGGVIDGLIVEAEVLFEGDAFVVDFGGCLGFCAGPVARRGVGNVRGLGLGHSL